MTLNTFTAGLAELDPLFQRPIDRSVDRKNLVISVEPVVHTHAVGEVVDVVVRVSGLRSRRAPSLGAFEISLSYDPAILEYELVSFSEPGSCNGLGPIAGCTTGAAAYPESGTLHLFGVSLDNPEDLEAQQPASFQLARLRFRAIRAGACPLNPFVVQLSDPDGASMKVAWTRAATVHPVPSSAVQAGSSLGAVSLAVVGLAPL